MALHIECISVVLRKSSVERKYPGGLDAFARQPLFGGFFEDEHLVRFGFMSSAEAWDFVAELETAGLGYHDASGAADIAVFGTTDEVPGWLTVGETEGHRACWLSGHPPGEFFYLGELALVRFPEGAFADVASVIRALQATGGGVVGEPDASKGETTIVRLDCVRGAARVAVEVYLNRDSGLPFGAKLQRDPARRASTLLDVALMQTLVAALKGYGQAGEDV